MHKYILKNNVTKLLFLIFIFYSFFSYAQKYNFKHYGLEDGLIQAVTYNIIQDKDGNMWIGTMAGVSKFNGKEFINYSTEHGIANNFITASAIDTIGNIWLGHINGTLTKYDILTKKFEIIDISIYTMFKKINHIYIDKDNTFWISTDGAGIVVMNNFKQHIFAITSAEELNSEYVLKIIEPYTNQLICATQHGICILNKSSLINYFNNKLTDSGLIYPKESIICINSKDVLDLEKNTSLHFAFNKLWVGFNGGILISIDMPNQLEFNKNDIINSFVKYKTFNFSDGTAAINNPVNAIIDYNGCIFLSANNKGLIKLSDFNSANPQIQYYNANNGFINSNLICLSKDVENNLWVGSFIGIFLYPSFKFILFDKFVNNNQSIVFSVIEDTNHNIWLGSTQGVNKLEPLGTDLNLYYNITSPKELSFLNQSQSISGLFIDKNNQMWIGTMTNGFYTYNFSTKNLKHYKAIDGITLTNVYSFSYDQNDNILIGAENGIFQYEFKTNKLNSNSDAIPGMNIVNVQKIFLDSKNLLWVGSFGNGLTSYDGTKITKYSKDQGLESNIIRGIVEDKQGNIWIGTMDKGIYKYDSEKFINYSTKEGLNSNTVFTLFRDSKNYIWIGSNFGIDRFNPINNEVKFYGQKDGFMGIECNTNAACEDYKGNIWFGTFLGAVRYNPNEDVQNTLEPITNINSIEIFNTPADFPPNDVFPYDQNYLTFKFTGVSLTNPVKVRYQYKLEGFDKEWSQSSKKTEVTYSFIPSGKYKFMVKSCNNDGLWNKQPVVYSFSIAYPFWKTWWFYLICIVLVANIIYFIFKIRIKSLKQAQKNLEKTVQDRTKELNDKNEELKKLSIVANETDNVVVICDVSGNIEWTNNAFTKISGYTLDEFISKHGINIIQNSHSAEIEEYYKRCISTKKSVIFETKNFHRSGTEYWTQSTLTPILDEINNISKLIVIDSNITQRKLAEIEIEEKNKKLWNIALAINKEKEKVEDIKKELEEKNRHIMDSINYAQNIQQAVLPNSKEIDKVFNDYFIFYIPKDVVSGDFYWYYKVINDDNTEEHIIAAVDCTGHGVPGAFMSMIGNDLLNQIIIEKGVYNPGKILTELDKGVRFALRQTNLHEPSKDGMDVILCKINFVKKELEFSSALRPLWYYNRHKGNTLEEMKKNSFAIGGFELKQKNFKTNKIKFNNGDSVYLTTDGYSDQFGGRHNKRLMKKGFVEVLRNIQDKKMSEQKVLIEKEFLNWKKNEVQTDDILVIGIKL